MKKLAFTALQPHTPNYWISILNQRNNLTCEISNFCHSYFNESLRTVCKTQQSRKSFVTGWTWFMVGPNQLCDNGCFSHTLLLLLVYKWYFPCVKAISGALLEATSGSNMFVFASAVADEMLTISKIFSAPSTSVRVGRNGKSGWQNSKHDLAFTHAPWWWLSLLPSKASSLGQWIIAARACFLGSSVKIGSKQGWALQEKLRWNSLVWVHL